MSSGPTVPPQNPPEKRRNRRARVFQPAVLEVMGSGDFLCEIRDFCRSGAYLRVSDPADEALLTPSMIGTPMHLQFSPRLNRDLAPVRVSGLVARVAEGGIGVSFSQFEPDVLAILADTARAAVETKPKIKRTPPSVDVSVKSSISAACRAALEKGIPEMQRLFGRDVDQALFGAAEEAKDNKDQSVYFDAISLLKDQSTLAQKFRATALEGTTSFAVVDRMDAAPDKSYSLSLVDPEEFEDWLNLITVATKLEGIFQMELETLKPRLSAFAPVAVDLKNNPYGPQALLTAFAQGLDGYGIKLAAKKIVYGVFGSALRTVLRPLYEELMEITASLAPAGTPKPAISKAKGKPRADTAKTPPLPAGVAPGAAGASGASGTALPGAASAAVGAASEMPTAPVVAPPITADVVPTPPAPRPAISLGKPGAVATFSVLRSLVAAPVGTGDGAGAHPGSGAGNGKSGHFPAQGEIPVAEFVGTVVDCILADPVVALGLKPLFQRWRQPLSRFAERNPEMLDQDNHPARRFLDALDEVSLAADDNGMLTRRLEQKLDFLVNQVSSGSEQSRVYLVKGTEELKNLTRLLRLLRERRLVNLREEYEGEERRDRAHLVVEAEIDRLTAGKKVPKVLIDLLNVGWRQWLILKHMSKGTSGEDWGKGLAVVDMILEWLQPGRDDPPAADVYAMIDFLARQLPLAEADPKVSQRLLDLLATYLLPPRQTPTWVDLPQRQAKGMRSELVLPIQDWLTQFKVGDWLQFHQDSGHPIAARLSWISEDHGRYLFTNIKGNKQFEFKAEAFVSLLEKDQISRIGRLDAPLTERTLNTVMQSLLDRLRHQSSHDPVTDLLNARAFRNELARFLRGGSIGDYVLCVVEIDQLRLILNRCGLDATERLIRDIAQRMRKMLHPTERAGRLGEQHFAVLFSGSVAEGGLQKAQTLLNMIHQQQFKWEDTAFPLGANIGMVPVVPGAGDADDLLKEADTACLNAKDSGQNRIKIYDLDDDNALARKKVLMGWAERVDSVLAEKESRLFPRCQMIIPLGKGDTTPAHYEVLLGVIGDNRATLELPGELLRAAEYWKRMVEIDIWQVESVFRWIRSAPERLDSIGSVSINLSSQSFNSAEFRGFLSGELRKATWPLSKLVFEVTEAALAAEIDQAEGFLRHIRRYGCRIALDDFGTGLSSYAYLKGLRPDYLKIDGAFVRELADSPHDLAMVKSVNEIAHSLGMKTIAEHVETEPALEKLREIGVDFAQGFLISKPIPLDDLI